MQLEITQKLLSINRQFYQTFAHEFDATRQRTQPGVARVLDLIPDDARILDLGCGNGEVARELVRRGFRGRYVGVDFSEGLLQAARETCQVSENLTGLVFLQRDLTAPDWETGLEGPFEVVLAFAVLHHLPVPFHAEIMRKVQAMLANPPPSTTGFIFPKPKAKPSAQDAPPFPTPPLPHASSPFPPRSPAPFPLFSSSSPPLFIVSNWQFLNSPRWQARVQPWERVGLTANDVAPNDYLLDWRHGGEGVRYVHHFSEEELAGLAETTGFEIVETFHSDGKEGNLALYQIWRPKFSALPFDRSGI